MDHMRRSHNAPYRSTSYAFDSVWAAALLYQRSLSYPDYRPENVKFRSRDVRELYASFLSETRFEGLSVSFCPPSDHNVSGKSRVEMQIFLELDELEG
jgi:hypothetical protein